MSLVERCEAAWPLGWQARGTLAVAAVGEFHLTVREPFACSYPYSCTLRPRDSQYTIDHREADTLHRLLERVRDYVVEHPPHIPEMT